MTLPEKENLVGETDDGETDDGETDSSYMCGQRPDYDSIYYRDGEQEESVISKKDSQ